MKEKGCHFLISSEIRRDEYQDWWSSLCWSEEFISVLQIQVDFTWSLLQLTDDDDDCFYRQCYAYTHRIMSSCGTRRHPLQHSGRSGKENSIHDTVYLKRWKLSLERILPRLKRDAFIRFFYTATKGGLVWLGKLNGIITIFILIFRNLNCHFSLCPIQRLVIN